MFHLEGICLLILPNCTASLLGLKASEFVYKPFKSWVSVSHSPSALLEISSTGFKARHSGGSSFQCRYSWRGAELGAWALSSSGGTYTVVITLPLVDLCSDGVASDQMVSLSILPVSLWSFQAVAQRVVLTVKYLKCLQLLQENISIENETFLNNICKKIGWSPFYKKKSRF